MAQQHKPLSIRFDGYCVVDVDGNSDSSLFTMADQARFFICAIGGLARNHLGAQVAPFDEDRYFHLTILDALAMRLSTVVPMSVTLL